MAEDYKFEKERSFTIDMVSDQDGQRYQGSFLARRLTIGDFSRVGAIQAQLNGSSNVDDSTNLVNEMIATCEVAVDRRSAPPWWNPRELFDLEILSAVYKEVTAFSTFRAWRSECERKAREAARTGANGGASEQPRPQLDGGSPQVVDLKV